MADSSDKSVNCPVLTGADNFQIWKIRIRAALQRAGVYGIVTGSEPAPSTSTTIYPSTSGVPSDIAQWNVRAEKALGIIVDHISDAIALKYEHLDKAKDLFDAIVKEYQDTNVGVSAFYAWVSLANARWDGTSSMSDHIGTLTAANRKLTALK
ncbi:hypothetical protein C8Q76DRAFT_607912, partial [Earliella scabrosa]